MQKTRSYRSRWMLLLSALALAVTACGDGGEQAGPGTDGGADEAGLQGAQLAVGSKEFTEQLVLGHMAILVLEDAGASVDDQTGLVGSATVREALTTGQIDLYWEYTGTGWITHLGNTEPIPDAQEQYEAVAQADAANGVIWLPPAPLDNTYAIATNADNFEQFEVATLSDFATFVQDNPDQATLCAAAEFLGRDDGLPGLEEHYGFQIPPGNIRELELGIVYEAVGRADPCNFGEVFTTDGRILAQDLQIIEDDQSFFPKYNASLNVRTEVLEQHPQLEQLFAPVTEALTNETMIELNARVDVDGELPEDVAQGFLEEQGLIGG